MFIPRPALQQAIQVALRRSRIVLLIGPRQAGKTTLARQFLPPDSLNYFDLEDPVSLQRLEQPLTALQPLQGLVVIDEIQRKPDIFPLLRVLSDRDPAPARFLILGSASPDLTRAASESLTGRVEILSVPGFSLAELGIEALRRHWLRGGLPPSFLAEDEEDSLAWRKNFIQTLLERDLPQWGVRIPAPALLRFWRMLAHYHGQVWNAAEPARALGISQPTARRYLDVLEEIFMMRVLPPWHENLSKRQVKAPKVYFRDSGLLHFLLGIRSELDLHTHPKLGASWEGYALEEVLKAVNPDEVYFWGTHGGAELDLLIFKDGQRLGVECKHSDAPRLTASMRAALADLRLDRLLVFYPGERPYSLDERVHVLPLSRLVAPEFELLTAT